MSKKKAAALVDQAAAANRAKSEQIVNKYPDAPSQSARELISHVGSTPQLSLPLPSGFLTDDFNNLNVSFPDTPNVGLGFGFTQAESYEAAQADDMAFFPSFDDNDPAYLAVVKEIGEAFEAGYYNDDLFSKNVNPSYADSHYELTEYRF